MSVNMIEPEVNLDISIYECISQNPGKFNFCIFLDTMRCVSILGESWRSSTAGDTLTRVESLIKPSKTPNYPFKITLCLILFLFFGNSYFSFLSGLCWGWLNPYIFLNFRQLSWFSNGMNWESCVTVHTWLMGYKTGMEGKFSSEVV